MTIKAAMVVVADGWQQQRKQKYDQETQHRKLTYSKKSSQKQNMWWPLFIHTFCFIHFTTKLRDTPENKDLSKYMKKTDKTFCTKQMNKTFHPTITRQAGDVSPFSLEGRILGSCWNPSIFQIGISQNRTVYDSLGGFHRWLLLFSAQKFYPYSLRTKDRLGPLGCFKACASWRGSSAWSSGVKVWL